MIEIVQGSDKNLIVRIDSADTLDPYDLTGVSLINACFLKTDGTSLEKFYLLKSGDTTIGSDTILNIDTTDISVGQSIIGAGIPANSLVAEILTSTSIRISANATATATGVVIEVDDIVIMSNILGKIKIQLHEEDTESLESGEGKNFEIRIVKSGFTSYVRFPESLNVEEKFC